RVLVAAAADAIPARVADTAALAMFAPNARADRPAVASIVPAERKPFAIALPAVAALVRIRPKAVLTPLLAADSPFEIALPMRDPILRNPSAALLAPDLILSHVIIAPSCAVSRPETRLPPIAVPAVLSAGPIL